MATTKANVLQTSFNVAASVVAAELSVGIITDSAGATARLLELKDTVFGELSAAQAEEPATVAPAPSSGGASTGGSTGSISLADAQGMKMSYGAFKGLSLAEIADVPTGDSRYDKGGVAYVTWLAETTDEKKSYASARAKLVLASIRAAA